MFLNFCSMHHTFFYIMKSSSHAFHKPSLIYFFIWIILQPHRCHYGACPPCRLICEEEYPCGHKCNLRFVCLYANLPLGVYAVIWCCTIWSYFLCSCHGPKPPPNPEFTLKPKSKKYIRPSESTPGLPCPPCPELVWRSCRRRHVGAERMVFFNICGD